MSALAATQTAVSRLTSCRTKPELVSVVECQAGESLTTRRSVAIREQSVHPDVYRVGLAVGGAVAEPVARAGSPGMNRLQPLLPETRSRYGCNFSSMHRPSEMSLAVAV